MGKTSGLSTARSIYYSNTYGYTRAWPAAPKADTVRLVAGIASWIAHIAFWVLLVVGWGDMRRRRASAFLLLWLAGFVGRQFVPLGPLLFGPYVAVLAVGLLFAVFKGDIRVS